LMGRRGELENEKHPLEESILDIIAGAEVDGMRFTEIVRKAEKINISRSTVFRHLSKMVKDGIIKKEQFSKKKTFYKLTTQAVYRENVQRSLFSILSMALFNDILDDASSGRLSDEVFTEVFPKSIGVLAMYTLLTGLSMAKESPEVAGKWIEEGFGTLIQKDGWRVCLNRQIFGRPVRLRRPIKLKKPVMPEMIVEEGTIYVRLPEAIQPGLTARVLREMPKIPEERLKSLKTSLKKLYPEEIGILDQAFFQIREAANISSKEVKRNG